MMRIWRGGSETKDGARDHGWTRHAPSATRARVDLINAARGSSPLVFLPLTGIRSGSSSFLHLCSCRLPLAPPLGPLSSCPRRPSLLRRRATLRPPPLPPSRSCPPLLPVAPDPIESAKCALPSSMMPMVSPLTALSASGGSRSGARGKERAASATKKVATAYPSLTRSRVLGS